jgi:hypothetical protein
MQDQRTGTGTVTFYDPDENVGYIDPDQRIGDVVFRIPPGGEPVGEGDVVGFELKPTPQVTTFGNEALRVWKLVRTSPPDPLAEA